MTDTSNEPSEAYMDEMDLDPDLLDEGEEDDALQEYDADETDGLGEPPFPYVYEDGYSSESWPSGLHDPSTLLEAPDINPPDVPGANTRAFFRWDRRDPRRATPTRNKKHVRRPCTCQQPCKSQAQDPTTPDPHQPMDLPHLKEISNMAQWTVSSHKPSCGIKALRDLTPGTYWQSDGPQPHTLNIHFFKRVAICHIRMLLDYDQDESYTPTKMHFLAGTGYHDLQLVKEMAMQQPRGWIDIDLSRAGGPTAAEDEALARGLEREDALELPDPITEQEQRELPQSEQEMLRHQRCTGLGPTLRCWLLQVRILENHQNGKDTHMRGLQIFSREGAPVQKTTRVQANQSKLVAATGGSSSATSASGASSKGKGAAGSRADRILGLSDDAFGEPVLR